MIHGWIDALIFFLPAAAGNAIPVIANKIPVWNRWKTPLDFEKTFRGKRIFGANKTWRGLFSAAIVGGIVAWALVGLSYQAPINTNISFVFFGALMGFGAIAGDAIESFFKRQAGIKPGQSWFPYDQIDYIAGGVAVVLPFIGWQPVFILRIFILYFIVHLVFSHIGYSSGLKTRTV